MKNDRLDKLFEIAKAAHESVMMTFHDIPKPERDIASFEPELDDDIWRFVDLTNLKPSSTKKDILSLCNMADAKKCKTVCVNTIFAEDASAALNGSETRMICVAGFPLGCSSVEAIIAEVKYAESHGAKEVDIVAPAGTIIEGNDVKLYEHLSKIVCSTNLPVKVIIETCLHSKHNIAKTCFIAARAGAAFVKTSTGFGSAGATVEDVSLMRMCVGNDFGVKASGGIKTLSDARAMLSAGANRIGASSLE